MDQGGIIGLGRQGQGPVHAPAARAHWPGAWARDEKTASLHRAGKDTIPAQRPDGLAAVKGCTMMRHVDIGRITDKQRGC